MRTFRWPLCLLLVGAAACGGGGNNPHPDAHGDDIDAPGGVDAPDSMACAKLTTPIATIASYPGMYAGTTKGAGNGVTVAMGACTTEVGGMYYAPKGEDVVVKLTGLTVGKTYGVTLDTQEDLSFYVIRGCSGMSPGAGQCDVFDDATTATETGGFMAMATEEYIVVDSADLPAAPATGAFTLHVIQAQCTDDTGCSGATPACENFTCTACHDSFGCTATAAPVCSANHACVAGASMCTGDDARDNGTGDDGPATATTIAYPTANAPTVISGAVCNTPASEGDFYKLVVTTAGDVGIGLTFSGATNDLDIAVYDSAGGVVDLGQNNAGVPEGLISTLAVGTYYIKVTQYAPMATVAAVPYTLTLNLVACATEFNCATAAAPVCGPTGMCVAGPANCVGDDAGDTGNGDDGPAGARNLTAGIGIATTLNASVCNSSATEKDYYKVIVAPGEGLNLSLAWTGASDLDIGVSDSTGKRYGMSFYKQPETVALTYLPAGTYYIDVSLFSNTPSTAVTAYTISATRTIAQVCTTSTQCAAEFQTQLYRGSCTTGTCQFIPAGTRANGAACDSADDCTSARCSYISFESNAQKSVCTTTCTMNSDCTAVGANLTCITGLTTNFCVPSCGANTDCGANVGSATLDANEPWDYLTCTAATGVCAFP